MAKIKAFKGLLYNPNKIDIEKVITPPYDVISPAMQDGFYQKDPHNIVRLILGKEKENDTSSDNKYTRAEKALSDWSKKSVIERDKKDAFYVYTQEYLHAGKKRTRVGFIALMKIEDPKKSGILPHEYTLAKPKKDRLNLIAKTKANLSPIFTLFQDNKNVVNKILKAFIKGKDALFTVDTEGVVHRLWRMDDKKSIKRIRDFMSDKKIFIADGHHRYEVALTYRNELKKRTGKTGAADHVMMYFSNLSERGNLTILSTHRVVKGLKDPDWRAMKKTLEAYFDIEDHSDLGNCIECVEAAPRKKHSFGVYTKKGGLKILTLKEGFSAAKLIDSDKTNSLKKLDVTILHDLIIGKLLGAETAEGNVKYVRNGTDAAALVDNGDYEAAFFLRPTRVMQMKTIAEKGEMMPQKSTYFYPKLLTGLVVNKF